MSIFRSIDLGCPACGTPVTFELVLSVSADRRPDLRTDILEGRFQREACPACSTTFRVDPEFTYMDIARGQYIAVWPASKRGEWRACAERSREIFDDTLGERATPEARKIGQRLDPRVVFGWAALVEKLLGRQLGIDDRTLEVAKIAVLRSGEETPVPGLREFRLVGERDGDLVLAWVEASGKVGDASQVPRQLIADIEADAQTWAAARADVGEGDVVDFQREMFAG